MPCFVVLSKTDAISPAERDALITVIDAAFERAGCPPPAAGASAGPHSRLRVCESVADAELAARGLLHASTASAAPIPLFQLSNVTCDGLHSLLGFFAALQPPPASPSPARKSAPPPPAAAVFQLESAINVEGRTVVSGICTSGELVSGDAVLLGPDRSGCFVPAVAASMHVRRLPVPALRAGQLATIRLDAPGGGPLPRSLARRGHVLLLAGAWGREGTPPPLQLPGEEGAAPIRRLASPQHGGARTVGATCLDVSISGAHDSSGSASGQRACPALPLLGQQVTVFCGFLRQAAQVRAVLTGGAAHAATASRGKSRCVVSGSNSSGQLTTRTLHRRGTTTSGGGPAAAAAAGSSAAGLAAVLSLRFLSGPECVRPGAAVLLQLRDRDVGSTAAGGLAAAPAAPPPTYMGGTVLRVYDDARASSAPPTASLRRRMREEPDEQAAAVLPAPRGCGGDAAGGGVGDELLLSDGSFKLLPSLLLPALPSSVSTTAGGEGSAATATSERTSSSSSRRRARSSAGACASSAAGTGAVVPVVADAGAAVSPRRLQAAGGQQPAAQPRRASNTPEQLAAASSPPHAVLRRGSPGGGSTPSSDAGSSLGSPLPGCFSTHAQHSRPVPSPAAPRLAVTLPPGYGEDVASTGGSRDRKPPRLASSSTGALAGAATVTGAGGEAATEAAGSGGFAAAPRSHRAPQRVPRRGAEGRAELSDDDDDDGGGGGGILGMLSKASLHARDHHARSVQL